MRLEEKKMIERKISNLTDRQRAVIVESIQMVAGYCDGAHDLDGMGFNKFDSDRGKRLTAKSDGDSIVHVSIDTDPNEDKSKVLDHLNRYGFDWYFAISPIEMTEALIDDFGIGIVNAPTAPVVLVCEDQSARFLPNGIKTPEELKAEVAKGC